MTVKFSSDPRIGWIQKLVQLHVGQGPVAGLDDPSDTQKDEYEKSRQFCESTEAGFKNFLDSLGKHLMVVAIHSQNKNIRLLDDLDTVDPNYRYVLVSKSSPNTPISSENIRDEIQITLLKKTPVLTLYESLHSVYTPVLKHTKWGMNNKISDLVNELHSSLASVVRSNMDAMNSRAAVPETEILTIGSIADEYAYWVDQATIYGKTREKKERAQHFLDILQPIKVEFDQFKFIHIPELVETVDKIQDGLDELWRSTVDPPYLEERMKNLLVVMTDQMMACLQDKLSATTLMEEPFIKVKDGLYTAEQVCERLEATWTLLTSRYWPHFTPHPWTLPKFESNLLKSFTSRIKEIIELKSSFDLLIQLLSLEEQKELHAHKLLTVFHGYNALAVNKLSDQHWKTLVSQFSQSLHPIEEKVASKLTHIFSSLQNNPLQLLREFQRYSHLVRRESVAKHLSSQRDALVAHLATELKSNSADFRHRVDMKQDAKGKNIPASVNDLVWVAQQLTKVSETSKLVESLLKGKTSFHKSAAEFESELNKYKKEQFNDWVAETEAELDRPDGLLLLKKTGRLMELDYNEGKLRVNYDDRLVTLLREVRQLIAFGFPVPARIQQVADLGNKYYRHAVVLKQVAHFYNTIDQQMLPCQQAMLLDLALNFEHLVKNPKGDGKQSGTITWDTPKELEQYISKLQESADKLTSENRKLRKYHENITDFVLHLMEVDLVRNQTKYKEILGNIRAILYSVEGSGIRAEDTTTWRNHWDYQLYKALEHQYQLGLENMNEALPEIKVDLIFKQQKLQFRPPFEEIRAKYHREMKKFINIPVSFKGFGDGKLFMYMVENNDKSLITVYKKAEILFQNLAKVQDMFKDWVILGTVNIDEFVEEALFDVADWEVNFRLLKQKGKEAEQLPSSIQVDCISVSTAPVKAAIDDHLQGLMDSMLSSLRKSINKHMAAIEDFAIKGMDVLSNRPKSLTEIGEANAKHEEIFKAKGLINSHFEGAESKNKLLKSVAGSGIDTSQMQVKWSKLELMLEGHELMIKEQVDMFKAQITGRIQAHQDEIDKFAARWTQLKPKTSDLKGKEAAMKAINFIKDRRVELDEIVKNSRQVAEECKHFHVEPPEFTDLEALAQEVYKSEKTWSSYGEWTESLMKCLAEDWVTFRVRLHVLDELLNTWSDKIRSLEMDPILAHIQKEIDKMKQTVPCLKYVRGDVWTSEHWAELFHLLAIPKGITLTELTVGHIFDGSDALMKNLEPIKELNTRAQGEVTIREALQELDIWGASQQFAMTEYEDAKGDKLELIKEWKETIAQIGDNQSLLQSLKDSPYFKNFADKAASWEVKLAELDEYLRNLNTVQRKWVYLEPIFTRGALPAEQPRFARIDDDFRSIMSHVFRDKRVVHLSSYSGLKNTLVALVDQLERCQKALNEFLEEKRSKFARFYFLGDEDLLEILGQAKNPNVIQAHLKKLFAGVSHVQFDKSTSFIVAMKSAEGEVVPLENQVKITHEVELWLNNFAQEMKFTLKSMLKKCLAVTDIFKYPSQILSLAEYLHFTAKCEEAIQNNTLSKLESQMKEQLAKYTSFNYLAIENETERRVVELKVKALILDIIHMIDVVEQLQSEKASQLQDWVWQRQLRFYMSKEGECLVKMHNAEFKYTYEYQGNPPKLVHTPLTDKCYLTLTQAMASGFGGNPFGPAGTGKTESVKALGVLMGRQVLVFNCDEGIDYKSMGRIFVGLVNCGAWGCFDEFNRLEEAVLSTVSQQIQVIQAGLKQGSKTVSLLNKSVDLDPNSGIFVTLNPAGKGYGGRQKLPDNLKQLFRSVAMTHPQIDLISQVILFSEGFKMGKELGNKVFSIFTLCKQLLSPQQHYDWGLRPLKSTLWLAGQLLGEELKKGAVDATREAAIVVKALRVNTLSKLTFADGQRFLGLMNDVFPGVQVEEISYDELLEAVKETYKEMNLIFSDSQAEKIFQFYEATRQRMGVVIVGPSGSGKSVLWRVLKSALGKCHQKIKHYVVNPKAIDRQTLLGHMDMDTREWSDGVITFASRQAVKEPADVKTWIISDGDIDPEWVESLNSVLDDNRLLTMPNGERIQFGRNVNFIFETHNLKFASPATVSRMGMIFLSDEMVDVSALVKAWLSRVPDNLKTSISAWVDAFFIKSLKYFQQNNELVVDVSKVGLILNGLSHVTHSKTKLEFLYGLIRGFGSSVMIEHRLAYANELLQWAGMPSPDPKKTLDYFVNGNGKLELYQLMEPSHLDARLVSDPDRLPVVETTDVQQTMDVLAPWLKQGEAFVLVGNEGCGKSMILRHLFSKQKSLAVATIHCSAQTRSSHILQRLHQACLSMTTNTGRVLRPRDAERLVLHLKDINLPKPDKYETVELVQFLQQLLTYKGFYDASLEWVGIENIQIVCSMNPPSTLGRHPLSTRFTSVIRQCFITYSDKEQQTNVYRILLQPALTQCLENHPLWSMTKNLQRLASTMINIYTQVKSLFTVDVQPHYLFTPRDVSRLLVGFARYEYSSQEANELLEVLAYESMRLFGDRLVGKDAKLKFTDIVQSAIKSEWSCEINLKDTFYSFTASNSGRKTLSKLTEAAYQQIVTKDVAVFERDYKELNLCMFKEALERISRMERILGLPGGSILLAGRPGVGRSTAVELAAHMLKLKTVQLNVSRNYSYKLFAAEIKNILQLVAVEGQECVFIVEDYQLVFPGILEAINSLLSGGEIPGLYTHDELEGIFNAIKNSYSEEGARGTMLEYFVSRIKKNLRIVLLFDSLDPKFLTYCESNPALYSRCAMEWTTSWTTESMQTISKRALTSDESLRQIKDQDVIIKYVLGIHEYMVQSFGATPKHLLEYLSTYKRVFSLKRNDMVKKHKYLQSGLNKLTEASKYVDKLSADARQQSIELAEKQKEADTALRRITESMMKASDQKKEMETLSVQLTEEEEKLLVRKAAIERELAEVEPIIRQAKSAVGEIKSENLTEIRSLRAPPPAVRDVLEGVLRLMGVLDMSWNSMKGFLGKRTVKDEIMNFDARNITKQIRESVLELLRDKADSFDEVTIKRVSVTAAPLAMWVKANLQYASVLEKIGPLEADLARLSKSLDASRDRVKKLQEALSVVDQTVSALRDDFGNKTREAEILKANLEKATTTIQAAQALLEKLSGEGSRWSLQAEAIEDALKSLPVYALVASAFIAYLAGASEDVRSQVTGTWSKITGLSQFHLLKVLSTESDQLVWKQEGLPSDALSLENAIVILNSKTTPMLVDPSGQASAWLKAHLSEQKYEVVRPHDTNFVRTVELAVRFGKTLIIEEMSELEPTLYPILRKDLQKQGPRFVVQFGDKLIDYNEGFKLYLITRQSSFALPSNSAGLVNEINFTITRAGLSGQLLGITIKHEKPDLEVEKLKLLQVEDELKIQLSKLEESLLQELANSEGNILENKTLIESLNETKAKSITIAESLEESYKLQTSLDKERDKFLPLSNFGSSLFFVVSDIAKINHMYQFSLSSFLKLFEKALKQPTDTGDNTDSRIKSLMHHLQKLVYASVSRSLFKNDCPMFALHLIRSLHPKLFQPTEWELFTGQLIDGDAENDKKQSEVPHWVASDAHNSYKQLVGALPELVHAAQFHSTEIWSSWMKSSTPEKSFTQTNQLSLFQKVLIVQALRSDRLFTAITDFVCQSIQIDSMTPLVLNMKKLYSEETMASEPILFITTPGADPSMELRELASKQVGMSNFFEISMGQGQGDIAIKTLHECAKSGKWLHLQNVHLVTSWLSTFEKELLTAIESNMNSNFRLWMTSEEHAKFPSSLLQKCLKITVEAPPGVKKNLQRIYEGWTPEFVASGSVLRSQALFALAWFHAVIQERRAYIPQGWNKFYEFSAADLRSSAELVASMCSGTKPPQWSILHGLLENAVYGARIDDIYDDMKLKRYLMEYFNDNVFSIGGKQPSKKLMKNLALPMTADYSAYVDLIKSLPEQSEAAIGLPANADRSLQLTRSLGVIEQLKILRQLDVKQIRFDKQKWIKELTPFLQLWKKLHNGIDILSKKPPQGSSSDPLLSFLDLELSNGIQLVQRIHNDLTTLSKVLRGAILVTNDMMDIATSLMGTKTPSKWSEVWEGPENPTSFMKDAVQITVAIHQLCTKAHEGKALDAPIQLSKFLSPNTFLNALRQVTSRQVKQSIDSLRLVSAWNDSDLGNLAVKIKVEGLYVQGCRFEGQRVSECTLDDPALNTAPTCFLAWVPQSFSTRSKLDVPLYLNPTREKVVCALQIPSQDEGTQWILNGVALFLNSY